MSKNKDDKNKTDKNHICDVCGKPVRWGNDGCPVVKKGNEMGALFGNVDGWRHYNCKLTNKK